MAVDDLGAKVVHVVLSLDVGGLERVVLDLARRGPSLGQEVVVVCLERPGTLAPLAEAAGAAVLCVSKPPGRRPEAVGRLREVFDKIQPDVIHTHQIGALFYAGPAARSADVRAVVHTEHGNHVARCRSRASRLRAHLLRAVAGRHADRFFCVSAEIAGAVAGLGAVPRRKISVVPNGIDTASAVGPGAAGRAEARASLGLPPSGPVVGTMGRLAEVKRQDLLIRGFARIAGRHPEGRLVLIGEGPERTALERLVAELGLGGRVLFVGYRPDPERLLPGLDVFALTSRSEGMPLSILEAWAAGVPVVASRVGGVPALIEHGRTGLLFDRDDELALAAHLSDLLFDPDRARRIGEAGRARAVAEFDAGVMAATYDRHYREVLAAATVASR